MRDEDFLLHFPRVANGIVDRARVGMGQAGLQLMADASLELPTTPHLTGMLRGSGSVFVGKKFIGRSTDASPGKTGTPATENNVSMEDEKEYLVSIVGFNTVYANRMHEGVTFNFTQPGSGAKFLEKKLMGNRKRYFQIVANKAGNP